MNKQYKENTILFPLFVLLTLLCLFIMLAQAFAVTDANTTVKTSIYEERVDGKWTIEKGMGDRNELLLSINGEVVHGDRLRYRLMNDCETINVLTQFSTMKENPKTEKIKKLYVSAKYIEEDINVHIPFVNKMPWKEAAGVNLDMWVFWVDLGWYTIDLIKEYHKNMD